jgi:hypothetical protein
VARNAYLYRLNVTIPEAFQELGWEPPGWREDRTDEGGSFCGNPDGFSWPPRRMYVSATGAHIRKRLLEDWGAKVTVTRSLPVEWPEPITTDPEAGE